MKNFSGFSVNKSVVLVSLLFSQLLACTWTDPTPPPVADQPITKPLPKPTPNHSIVNVSVLQSFNVCPSRNSQARVEAFDSLKAWERHLSSMSREDGQRIVDFARGVDWARHSLAVVGLGQKPNAGFGLEIRPQAQLNARHLILPMNVIEPSVGGMQASVVTFPCSYLRIDSQAYDQIEVQTLGKPGKGLVSKKSAAN